MALIKCSNCEKDISDKAKVCPHCGQAVVLDALETEEAAPLLCEECGAEISVGMESCPNCGCPVPEKKELIEESPQKVEVTAVNLPPLLKIQKNISLLLLLQLSQ